MCDVWKRYCEKMEELRRLQDEARKRRKPSTAGVKETDKVISVSAGVTGPIKGLALGTNEGDCDA